MRVFIFVIITIVFVTSCVSKHKYCKKGSYDYHFIDYSKEKIFSPSYQEKIDSMIGSGMQEKLCNDVEGFPRKLILSEGRKKRFKSKWDLWKYKRLDRSVLVQPICVNVKNYNGVYIQRVFVEGAGSGRMRCKINNAFIIQDNQYVELGGYQDSIQNDSIIRASLINDFTEQELNEIATLFKHGQLCVSSIYNFPVLIKKEEEVLFQ